MQELAFIEFYSGDGEVWKAVSGSTVTAAKVDINYYEKRADRQNPMDINTCAGLASLP